MSVSPDKTPSEIDALRQEQVKAAQKLNDYINALQNKIEEILGELKLLRDRVKALEDTWNDAVEKGAIAYRE